MATTVIGYALYFVLALAVLTSIKYPKSQKPLILWGLIGVFWATPNVLAYFLYLFGCGYNGDFHKCFPMSSNTIITELPPNIWSKILFLPLIVTSFFEKIVFIPVKYLGEAIQILLAPLVMSLNFGLIPTLSFSICISISYLIQRGSLRLKRK